VVGICGGHQILGRSIRDPEQVEARVDETTGLALLPTETRFGSEKETHQVTAGVTGAASWMSRPSGRQPKGYEIHMGHTQRVHNRLEITDCGRTRAALADGALSAHGRIWGCYLHGLFANRGFHRAWLASLGWTPQPASFVPIDDPSSTWIPWLMRLNWPWSWTLTPR